jgi:cellulose synthase/poly-beta-1,6-N-acetylglucosamine synthase-like glycosyltransferase
MPFFLMAPLFGLTLAFGATLAVLIASGFVDAALRELRYGGQIWLGIWFVVIGRLSFFVLTRWCAVQTLGFLEHYCTRRVRTLESWPFVSILVPAYQEAETIALRSFIDLDYPIDEIIVVDDGSTDQTAANALPFVGNHGRCRVELLRKPNGGKWSALNLGFARSMGELVLCIDADSHLSQNALKRLVVRMDRPDISPVSGQITVRNRRNLITRLQAYEYVVANGGLRTAQSFLGSVLVVPGPIGLYRRSALVDLANADRLGNGVENARGPFSPETFAEDFQLSLSILAHGGRIVYEPRALSYTKSPHLTPVLLNQRYRWYRGTLQVLRIYRRRLRKLPGAKARRLSAIVAAIYLLDLSVLPVANLTILFGVTISIAASGQPGDVMLWVAAIWLLNLMTSAYHIVAQGDDFALLPLVPLYDLYHGLLLNAAWALQRYSTSFDARICNGNDGE